MSLASYHCSTLPYAPFGASLYANRHERRMRPLGQWWKKQDSHLHAVPVSAPRPADRTMQPASAFAILPYFPPRVCRTGKKWGVKKRNAGLSFIPHLHNAIIAQNLYDIL